MSSRLLRNQRHLCGKDIGGRGHFGRASRGLRAGVRQLRSCTSAAAEPYHRQQEEPSWHGEGEKAGLLASVGGKQSGGAPAVPIPSWMAVTRGSAKRSSCCASTSSAAAGVSANPADTSGNAAGSTTSGAPSEDSSMQQRGAGQRSNKRPALVDRTNNGLSGPALGGPGGAASFGACPADAIPVSTCIAPTIPPPSASLVAPFGLNPPLRASGLFPSSNSGSSSTNAAAPELSLLTDSSTGERSSATGDPELHHDAMGHSADVAAAAAAVPSLGANAAPMQLNATQGHPAGSALGPAAGAQPRPSSKRGGGGSRGRCKGRGASGAAPTGPGSTARRRRSESVSGQGKPLPSGSLRAGEGEHLSSMECDRALEAAEKLGSEHEEAQQLLLSNETLQCPSLGDGSDGDSIQAPEDSTSVHGSGLLGSMAMGWASSGEQNQGTWQDDVPRGSMQGVEKAEPELRPAVFGSVFAAGAGCRTFSIVGGSAAPATSSHNSMSSIQLLAPQEDLGPPFSWPAATLIAPAPGTQPFATAHQMATAETLKDVNYGSSLWSAVSAVTSASGGGGVTAVAVGDGSDCQQRSTDVGAPLPAGLLSVRHPTIQKRPVGDAAGMGTVSAQDRLQGSAVQASESAMASLQRHAERSWQISSIRQNKVAASGSHEGSWLHEGFQADGAVAEPRMATTDLSTNMLNAATQVLAAGTKLDSQGQAPMQTEGLLAPQQQQPPQSQMQSYGQQTQEQNIQDGKHMTDAAAAAFQPVPGNADHAGPQGFGNLLPVGAGAGQGGSSLPGTQAGSQAPAEPMQHLGCKGVMAQYMDIDSNLDDPQLCAAYAPEIFQHLKNSERRRPSGLYMETVQTDINEQMRGILIDWLVEVAEEYKLVADTLYLTCSFIDRYLSSAMVTRGRLQLLGVSCMLIASKYEEIYAPQVDEFCYITDNTYRREEVIEMERGVLKELHFELSYPTIKSFLRRFIRAAQADLPVPSIQLELLGNYFAELTLVDYKSLKFLPSVIAASAVFLAKRTLWPDSHPWVATLRHYSGYLPSQLKECTKNLHDLHCNKKGCNLPAIREKYRQAKFQHVAAIPPLADLPDSLFEDVMGT